MESYPKSIENLFNKRLDLVINDTGKYDYKLSYEQVRRKSNIKNINIWEKYNIIVLEHLYNKLIDIAQGCGITLFDDEYTYKNFIKMMYNESDKTVIDYDLFPEYDISREDDSVYDKYIITEE
jgi:hypothetical protein